MQFQIRLVLLTLSFLRITTQNAADHNVKNYSPLSSDEDTPSPEWIRYQQERFQDLDKAYSNNQHILKSSSPSDPSPILDKQEFGKWQTSSRQENPQKHDLAAEGDNSNFKESEETFEDEASSAIEFPSIKGFVEFIKSIKQSWLKHSLFRIEDKIKMLHHLKDSLMKTIERQFKILWQDDDNAEDQDDLAEDKLETKISQSNQHSHLRRKRGILDESNINFPPDAALISINFLTFAVFLIKLVLQVVNIIKTKHYQFSTLNMDTGVIRNG